MDHHKLRGCSQGNLNRYPYDMILMLPRGEGGGGTMVPREGEGSVIAYYTVKVSVNELVNGTSTEKLNGRSTQSHARVQWSTSASYLPTENSPWNALKQAVAVFKDVDNYRAISHSTQHSRSNDIMMLKPTN